MSNEGFGCSQFTIAVYIANKPSMVEYENCVAMHAMTAQEITKIGIACGNGWRKVFNVYSKLLYALDSELFSFSGCAPTWQGYRDNFLLQQGSGTALLFSPPLCLPDSQTIHIISGKTYAKALINSDQLMTSLIWLDESFAIDVAKRLIVCPYFDYRQLSNQKIEYLADLIKQLMTE
ncbi:hypothetical protein GCM10007916_29420 [Psychromonas marina]|uniref:Uncharacterized protein n=1 Tax=Psychromonas marina TaxID=88364 RepID=A0ABQ6E3F0_9GAMM|nr:hypothetical protein [Psychromonas marina]GLS91872.1 hypothetical protein GCM10007916_29420 [Psychromonas marina]